MGLNNLNINEGIEEKEEVEIKNNLKKVDGLNKSLFTYVEPIEIDKEMECMICFQPFLDPVIEPNCRQMFCKDCLGDSLQKSNCCPFCKKEFSMDQATLPPRFISNLLDNLNVQCMVCNDGSLKIKRKDHKKHLETDCKSPCKQGCGSLLTFTQINEHRLICFCRDVPCPGKDVLCKWIGKKSELEEHQLECDYLKLKPLFVDLLDQITKQDMNIQGLLDDIKNNHQIQKTQDLEVNRLKLNVDKLQSEIQSEVKGEEYLIEMQKRISSLVQCKYCFRVATLNSISNSKYYCEARKHVLSPSSNDKKIICSQCNYTYNIDWSETIDEAYRKFEKIVCKYCEFAKTDKVDNKYFDDFVKQSKG
ncbi:Q8IVH4 Methylmalonic aciduria type A protein [Tieghemostelium lacteum]|uniref:Q8IVH4 Methylmalonic aciduria type A protein n=1 Tax=Tieghemostelium lacteum TaxID=361077 RepID=A0A151ZJK6_TIELA|nr:Q8IVH4 Methylmalonic aciduria type A protein [Tieghemostelium lacteum]|eukprot:KYQ94136.1 Q8IVH4 Methylmalonic aciduria type A protein [Tieghemostelium lacteum]